MIAALIPVLAPIVGDLIKRVAPDQDKKIDIERELNISLLTHASKLEGMKGEIVLAEAKSKHSITAMWRPILMLVIVAIIAIQYLFFPVINLFYPDQILMIDLPEELWNLLQLGVGGYIVGRSGEKMIEKYKEK